MKNLSVFDIAITNDSPKADVNDIVPTFGQVIYVFAAYVLPSTVRRWPYIDPNGGGPRVVVSTAAFHAFHEFGVRFPVPAV